MAFPELEKEATESWNFFLYVCHDNLTIETGGNVMAKTHPFDAHLDQYEKWFKDHRFVYDSELAAIKVALPPGRGVEIGVGSGLFASQLGINDGVEPSAVMAALALERGIHIARGVAEELPYHNNQFDFALMVTTICFVDQPEVAIKEMKRVVRPGGALILAFVDRDSPLGKTYEQFKEQNIFYRDALFYSAEEIMNRLTEAGLKLTDTYQTVFGDLDQVTEVQISKTGYGEGGFVILKAEKPQ